jgi:hypothetical protein
MFTETLQLMYGDRQALYVGVSEVLFRTSAKESHLQNRQYLYGLERYLDRLGGQLSLLTHSLER